MSLSRKKKKKIGNRLVKSPLVSPPGIIEIWSRDGGLRAQKLKTSRARGEIIRKPYHLQAKRALEGFGKRSRSCATGSAVLVSLPSSGDRKEKKDFGIHTARQIGLLQED